MDNDFKKAVDEITPPVLEQFAKNGVRSLNELFPGPSGESVRVALRQGQVGTVRGQDGQEVKVVADVDAEGNVFSMAAAVSRTPTKSETYLRNVPDLQPTGGLDRKRKIELFHSIARSEGIVNNALKKKGALVSQDGHFSVKTARSGKRPRKAVANDLLSLLEFWQNNVNSAAPEAAITGSRGLRQVIRRGSRQAMIEGDYFGRQIWKKVTVPQLGGKKFNLPIVIQSLPAADIEIAEDLVGLGIDAFYWVPTSEKIQALIAPRDPNVRKIIQDLVDPKIINELKRNRKVLLDPTLMFHVKNAGVDTEAYGQSDVEAALTDLAYARALKSLDFVTIDSLINRMLVIKIGDENPESAYHNLATAQSRVSTFARLIRDVGPNMLILWAGHDVDTTDIGAHQAVLDTDDRHKMAGSSVKMATGVPDPLLTGSADGGNAVAWAGFISLNSVAAELQEEWEQSITQLGLRIAEQNNFKDVELEFQFAQSLVADREANSKIMLQAYQLGMLSKRTFLEELGKDFDAEKERKLREQEDGDDELFVPTQNKGGPAGLTGPEPESQPGRPDKTEDPDKIGPDRDREDKDTGNPDSRTEE
jgi:hypothetical protein